VKELFLPVVYYYDWCHLIDCGSRTAGELLFCQQQQKSNQKNAATSTTPLVEQGYPSSQQYYHAVKKLAHKTTHGLRQFSQKAHDNTATSLAC
jgi:hypothetical protein